MKNKYWTTILFTISVVNITHAETESRTLDRVRLFDSFFVDAVRLDSPYVEINAGIDGFENGNSVPFQFRAGLPVTSNIDISGSIGGIDVDPDFGKNQMDVTDFTLVGRYHFTDFKPANLSAGLRFDLPTGDNDLGQDTLEFEAFGAIRIPVNEQFVTTAHLGFGYVETYELKGINGFGRRFFLNHIMETTNGIVGSPPGARVKNEGNFAFFASTGAIYEITPTLHVMGEFSGDTGHGVGYFTSGVDFEIIPNARLRFGVGAGFGERAPEYTVQGGFLFNFGS